MFAVFMVAPALDALTADIAVTRRIEDVRRGIRLRVPLQIFLDIRRRRDDFERGPGLVTVRNQRIAAEMVEQFEIVARHVVQIVRRFDGTGQNFPRRGIEDERARGLGLLDFISLFERAFGDLLNFVIDCQLDIHAVGRGNVGGRETVYLNADDIRFVQDFAVDPFQVLIVSEFKSRLPHIVVRGKAEHLRHKIAVRINARIVPRVINAAQVVFEQGVELFARNMRSHGDLGRYRFGQTLVHIGIVLSEFFRNDLRGVFHAGKRLFAYEHRICIGIACEHDAVAVGDLPARSDNRDFPRPLVYRLFLQLVAPDDLHV